MKQFPWIKLDFSQHLIDPSTSDSRTKPVNCNTGKIENKDLSHI